MIDESQPVSSQQLPDTYYRTLCPWTLCLLIGSFIPIPVRPATSVTCEESKVGVQSPSPAKHLPLDLGVLGQKYPVTLGDVERARKSESTAFLSARVMARLQQAEAHEDHAHYRQDYRQAWICASFAQKGEAQPFLKSSYAVYGVHPDKVWPRWLEEQKARLGQEYFDWFDSAGNRRPDLPQSSYASSARALGVEPTGAADIPDARIPSKPSAPVFSVDKKEATA